MVQTEQPTIAHPYKISITIEKKKVRCKYKQKSFRVKSVMSRGYCGFRLILPYRQNIFLRVKKKVTDIKQISSGSTSTFLVIFTGVTVKPRESDSHSLLVKLEKVGQTVFKFQSMSNLITTDDRKQIQL